MKRDHGRYLITGPGVDRSSPSLGAAVAAAQGYACNYSEPADFLVREIPDRMLYRVTRDDAGSVSTKKA